MDAYRFENFLEADRAKALTFARSLIRDGAPLQTRLLEGLFNSADEFNQLDPQQRKNLFDSVGAQPSNNSANLIRVSQTSSGADDLSKALRETRQSIISKSQIAPAESAEAPPSDLQSALKATRQELTTKRTQEVETQKQQEAATAAANLASIPTPMPSVPLTTEPQPAGSPAPRQVGQVMQAGPNQAQRLGRTAASLFDVTVGGAFPGVLEPITYAGARALGKSDQEAKRISSAAAAPFESPLGRTLGITETPEYKGEVTRQLFDFAGENVKEFNAFISKKTGLPVNDVENMTGTMLAAVGIKAAPAVQRGIVGGAEKVETAIGTAPTAPAVTRVEPTMAGGPKPRVSYADFQAQLEARKTAGAGVAGDFQEAFDAKQGLPSVASTGANPYAGKFTGEEGGRGVFPQVKLSKMANDVPIPERELRSAVASEILGDADSIRKGVVTGNEQTLRNEYTVAKKAGDTPDGILMREQLAREQNALSDFALQRVENSGANLQLLSPAERGSTINSFFAGQVEPGQPANSLTSFFKQEKNALYQDARDRVGDNPIVTTNVNELLSDAQFRAGLELTGNEKVAAGVEKLIQLARDVGFKDQSGNFFPPNSIGAWDAVKKALNADWTKDNAKTIAKINNAIDRDIASAGGGDLLKRADSVHEMEKSILGSKGIKTIFGEIDSNGVETGIAFDNIPKKLNEVSFASFKHIYDTADKLSQGTLVGPIDPKTKLPRWELTVPEEVRAAATQAKNEMRGNLAREVYEAGATKAGAWNPNSTNKVLNARGDKIRYTFPVDEQKKFHTLNYGGYLMPEQHPYEGGALQARRAGLIERAAVPGGLVAGTAAGSVLDMGLGSMIGAYIGPIAGEKLRASRATKAEAKEAARRKREFEIYGEQGKEVKLKDIGK